ncbi:MAG: FAD:protein FMN transferase [Deltaproteobacteria bacterium]|nr:FAD:protein FMN transferase [Deltaproteobacteria bacterium]
MTTLTSQAHAETVQIILEETIAPDIQAHVLVVADSSQKTQVKETFKQAVTDAREILDPLRTDPLLKGHLADQIAEQLTRAGWENIFVDLGGIVVARGKDFNGVWKIPVVDDTTANAHHAFVFKAFQDVAVATVRGSDKNVTDLSNDLKSVTVFTNEGAAKAQDLALTGYSAGLNRAQKLLKKAAVERSVLIDQNGRFIQIPEGK